MSNKLLNNKLLNINFNYLNHNFCELEDKDWIGVPLICTVCNVNVFYYYHDKSYIIRLSIADPVKYEDRILKLNCDELIIKNIIE